MKLAPDPITVHDPITGQTWAVPAKPVTVVNADVAERWFINVALPLNEFRAIVSAPFLEPAVRNGHAVLSLCRIRIRHAAPDWMPLKIGPSSDNCAVRVGCIDSRDGSSAVWICQRLTTHILGGVLKRLGFPAVDHDMYVSQGHGFPLGGNTSGVHCTLIPERKKQPQLFANDVELSNWVVAGVRSYGASEIPNQFDVVDLEKGSPNMFTFLPGYGGILTTPHGKWRADGVYKTINGIYQWRNLGRVDQYGNPVNFNNLR